MPDTTTINTKKIQGRGAVSYQSLNEFWRDAQRVASYETKTIGNWSEGQIFEHLARSLNMSIDGTDMMPAPVRFALSLLFKKFMTKAIPAGFKTSAAFIPDETAKADGLVSLRQAIERQKSVSKRALHPGFGKITRQEWDQFHQRHAEMHMSFILDC